MNETNIYEINMRRLSLQILTCLIALLLFSKILCFHRRIQPSEKDVTVKEGLDGINTDNGYYR